MRENGHAKTSAEEAPINPKNAAVSDDEPVAGVS